jgi:hypothetical protein
MIFIASMMPITCPIATSSPTSTKGGAPESGGVEGADHRRLDQVLAIAVVPLDRVNAQRRGESWRRDRSDAGAPRRIETAPNARSSR